MSSYLLKSKSNGPVTLFETIFMHRNWFLSSVATDGKDEHGLKLEKIGPTFQSSFNAMPAKTTLQNYHGFVLPDEILQEHAFYV